MKVGVLAAGQLGRMMALVGYPLGQTFRFLEPSPNPPAAPLAELVNAPYDDGDALRRFAEGLDVVTYEFENVPAETAKILSEWVPFHPRPKALEISCDRLSEKELFRQLSIPTSPFQPVESHEDLKEAVKHLGLPAVLKARRMGYDGKGQRVLRYHEDLADAWEELGRVPMIYERYIEFDREISSIAARSTTGETVFYPLMENVHRDGILWTTRAPAPGAPRHMPEQAREYMRRVMEELDYAGVLTIEWFEYRGQLLANEMATRVHNSGHWTLNGAVTSQFENHLRAILGLPLGSPDPIGHSAMVNLVGTHPPAEAILAEPGARLHLYGKSPRPGRKLGHINLRADTPEALEPQLERIIDIVNGETGNRLELPT